MDAAKLQAQVRSLTRDVGGLREALQQEEKKRERLAAHAKASEAVAQEAQAKLKQLTYANTKLEAELRTAKERGEAAAAKGRAGLEAVRGRLAEVERSVHHRSVEAHRQVQRLHSLVQDLQAAAMPLAIASAASQAGPHVPPPPALKSSLPSSSHRAAAQRSSAPGHMHRQFSSVCAGLAQLAMLFSGSSSGSDSGNAAAVAPMLLTTPDGSIRSVRWQDQSSGATATNAAPGPASSAGASSSLAGSRPTAAGAAPSAPSLDADKERLATEVRRLRAALAESRQRVAVADASASAAAAAGTGGTGRVEAAMRQLDAVIPQYRAAAHSLQGQVDLLKEKLAAAVRDRTAVQDEVTRWQGLAARHEAAYAEAAAKLRTHEAQSLAASTQVQSQADRLQNDAEGLRRRCAELAARLRESQQAVAQLQASLAASEQLTTAQQQTIQQLEATVREQQADIRSALDLVSNRPKRGEGLVYEAEGGAEFGGYSEQGFANGEPTSHCAGGGTGWEEAPPSPSRAGDGYTSWQADLGGHSSGSPSGRLSSLLGAATAAADAAAAWAGSYGEEGSRAAAEGVPGPDAWAEAQYGGSEPGWTIPAAGSIDSWPPPSRLSSPQRPPGRQPPQSKQAAPADWQGKGHQHSAQCSPGVPDLASVEADIAGLEAALRNALGDSQQ